MLLQHIKTFGVWTFGHRISNFFDTFCDAYYPFIHQKTQKIIFIK